MVLGGPYAHPPFFKGARPHALSFLVGCHFCLAALKGIKPSPHLFASINGYRHHPSALCMCSSRGLQPNHLTCGLHLSSVDALVDIHDPSHNFPFFHPWEAFLVGHHVTALPSCSCGIIFSSPPREVVL